ncbi:ABC transporter permease [Clostridium sediminicola]|uniref:hypothetical protein n=1 Tax=Clostridium sediminicola TaxID=3114879 RepID=UPI0031F232D6
MIHWEFKKIFKSKTGLLVLIMFVFIIGVMVFIKPPLETENSYRNDKYELMVDSRSEKVIAQEKFNSKVEQIEAMANIKGTENFSKKMKELSEKKLRMAKNNEYEEVSFFKVFNHRATFPLMSVVMVIILVLIFSNIYTDERVSGVNNIILPSKNKFKVLYSKLALAIILPIIIYGSYLGIEFLITLVQYGTPVNGELQVFRIVDYGVFLKKAYTINGYLLLKIIMMALIFVSISVFASFFSYISSNSLASISGTLIFLVIGKACTIIKFLPDLLLILLSKANYVDLMFYPERFIGMDAGEVNILGKSLDIINLCNGTLIAMLFTGVILCIVTFKKVLTK